MNYDQNNLNSLQNTSLLPVPPPPQSKESTCSSSKYDSAISIPRPHRSSPTLKMRFSVFLMSNYKEVLVNV